MADAGEVLVQAEKLTVRYGPVTALDGVDLEVRKGEFVAVVGPTGSGKTTLLSLLTGLERQDDGSVRLLGERLEELAEDALADLRGQTVGMVYQSINLFSGFTVRENLGLPLRLMMRPPSDAHLRSGELVREFALYSLAERYPAELSGGQRQLVAIARALAARPPLIVADEPTANLDSSASRGITAQLRSLADSRDHGVLLATHDLRIASQADRVISLRDGRIVKETVLQPGRAAREVLAELA